MLHPLNPGRLPPTATDTPRAAHGLAQLQHLARHHKMPGDKADALAAIPADENWRRLTACAFAYAPFLGRVMLSDPAFLATIAQHGPDSAWEKVQSQLKAKDGSSDSNNLMKPLRILRKRVALLTALADIAGLWDFKKITATLSSFAQHAVSLAVDTLLRETTAADKNAPSQQCGFMVLALGKLGGFELNYSSDIDLVVLFDAQSPLASRKTSAHETFNRLTRRLIETLSAPNTDGFVFRVDLRLRPDPLATPPALSVAAAETYYESQGLTWERAAFIKARPLAGDLEAASRFLAYLRPFIWRRALDFTALEDIQAMREQVVHNKNTGTGTGVSLAGRDLKRDGGGIRDIEFAVQSLQLIWGGRRPSLRVPATLEALAALTACGLMEEDVRRKLARAYVMLRGFEHRLQMREDAQTHTLPRAPDAYAAFAAFAGFDNVAKMEKRLAASMAEVEKVCASYSPRGRRAAPALLRFGEEGEGAAAASLAAMGFKDATGMARLVAGWRRGRFAATQSERARALLDSLLPALLKAMAATGDGDRALACFDSFLSRLPAGAQLFALFKAHPALMRLVADIMGMAPRLATRLARRPSLLDTVLEDSFAETSFEASALREELAASSASSSEGFEELLGATRRLAKERKFRLGVRLLQNRTDAVAAAPFYTAMADALLEILADATARRFAERYGRLAGAGLAVVALGRYGAGTLAGASDLDLIFIYDEAEGGESSLPPPVYWSRLCQRFINALSAQTSEGELYTVDMRLRPSGVQGPVACSLAAFRSYQETDAWVWEHMALTRARVVHVFGGTGGARVAAGFRRRLEAVIGRILCRERDAGVLREEVCDMRRRMAAAHSVSSVSSVLSLWGSLKHGAGGMVDVDFILQFLRLRYGAVLSSALECCEDEAWGMLRGGGFLESEDAELLARASLLWRRLDGVLRLCFRPGEDIGVMGESLRRVLACAGGHGEGGFEALEREMRSCARGVRSVFGRLLSC